MTFILGLTGSIGMGKSTTADLFREAGVPVHDADATVHALYRGQAVAPVAAAFPGVAIEGIIDRGRLAAALAREPGALSRLEAIVHPLVREARDAFLKRHMASPFVLLDIPLLFETGGDRDCDAVIVVTAPEEVQRARVMARPGMTPERFTMIHVKQMPDHKKRARAHFLVDTSRGLDAARRQVGDILRALAGRSGQNRPTA
jgi:dephospho-CoA kinase